MVIKMILISECVCRVVTGEVMAGTEIPGMCVGGRGGGCREGGGGGGGARLCLTLRCDH